MEGVKGRVPTQNLDSDPWTLLSPGALVHPQEGGLNSGSYPASELGDLLLPAWLLQKGQTH